MPLSRVPSIGYVFAIEMGNIRLRWITHVPILHTALLKLYLIKIIKMI